MNGFKPGDDSCALRRYGAIVSFLKARDGLTEGEIADLEVELYTAMGSCAQACIDECMATSFYDENGREMHYARHPQTPSIWTVIGDMPKPDDEVEVTIGREAIVD